MFFKRFYDPDLAQASYMVGCQKTGECLVVDPVRDVAAYLDEAAAQGLRVTHVAETHIHADFLSGARELAERTGARLLLSDEGGADWRYSYKAGSETVKLRGGDTFMVGNIRIAALHTPGHTPEHLSFLITDTPRGDQPGMVLTGDFVFVGDLGRPDLLDEAAGGKDTRFQGARDLFSSLKNVFVTLPDFVQVWPGHGSGSACGKALGAVSSSTVGYEKALAWWGRYVENDDFEGFQKELLEGQPDAPLYYGRMKRQNKEGPALLGEVGELARLSEQEVGELMDAGAFVIDLRSKEEHRASAPRGVNLPQAGQWATWAGWLLRPEDRDYLLLGDEHSARQARRQLWMVGLDNVRGFVTGTEALETAERPVVDAAEVEAYREKGYTVLDVRTRAEHEEGHIPGSVQMHAGRLPWRLDELPQGPLLVHCQSGARSAAAASFLAAAGREVAELGGGFEAWAKANG